MYVERGSVFVERERVCREIECVYVYSKIVCNVYVER